MSEIIFYYNPMSRARIVRWMLEEVGVPFRTENVDLEKKQQKTAQFLAINPMGKLPTIIHRGVVVTEAAAICAYLADAFPAAGLAPALHDPARGTYLRWLFFGAGCIEPALVDKMYDRPLPAREGALGYGSYADTMNALDKAITPGPYILGDRFSAADVYVGAEMIWAQLTKTLEDRPSFAAYIARLRERSAFQRAFELPK